MHYDTSSTETNMAAILYEVKMTMPLEEAYFGKAVFYVLIDNVAIGLTARFNAVKKCSKKLCGNIPQCVNVSYKRKQKG